MGRAYVVHPDLDNQGAVIADDPVVISLYEGKGWVLKDLPKELDPESGNGPEFVKDQDKPEPEKVNGPGLQAFKAQDQPEPETVNGPDLQDQPESDDQEINGPGGLVVQLIAKAEQDQAEQEEAQEASRSKRSRKKEQTQPPEELSGKNHEGDES